MIKYYPYILGIMEKLNEWNEKLDKFSAENLDDVFVGTLILGGLIIISFGAVKFFNKR